MQSPPALNLLSPRSVLTGVTGAALSNVIVTELPDGALCFVVGFGLYQLDKTSAATVASPDIIAALGGGRWVRLQTSSGETASLSSTLFVDVGTTVPTSLQDGNISRPFTTIQQAVDVVEAAANDSRWGIVVGGGDYSAETTITGDFSGKTCVISSWGCFDPDVYCLTNNWDITMNLAGSRSARVVLHGISGVDIVTHSDDTSSSLTVKDGSFLSISGADAHTLDVMGSSIPDNQNGFHAYLFLGSIALPSGSLVYLTNVNIDTSVVCGTLSTQTVRLPNSGAPAVSCLDNAMFSMNTWFGAPNSTGAITLSFAAAGSWILDAFTNYMIKRKTETLTNITKVIAGDVTA